MKKVLVIGNRIPFPARDGGALATLQILKLYVKAGFEVDFVSLNTNKHYVAPEIIQSELNFLSSVQTVDINTDLSVTGLLKNLCFTRKSYNLERFYSYAFEQAVLRQIKDNNYAFIHLESLFSCTVLPMIKKQTSASVYVRVHNIEHQIWKKMAESADSIVKRIYLKIMANRLKREELSLYALSHGLLYISHIDMEYYRKQLPAVQHFYLPYIVNSIEDGDALNQITHSVCFIGSMEWLPNLQGIQWFLDKVWNNVRVAIPQAVLRIAGKGIGNKIQSNSAKGIEVVGEVPFSTVFMKQHQDLIVPLFSGSGIRIKTIEAMSNGVPVISTSIGAQGLSVTNRDEILIADTAKDFAKAVIELLQVESLRNTISSNGKVYVQKHHNEASAIDLLSKL